MKKNLHILILIITITFISYFDLVKAATVTQDSYYATVGSYTPLYSGNFTRTGQSITASVTANVTSISFQMKKIGSPTGNMTAKIYAESNFSGFGVDSRPTGSVLATSDTLAASTLSTSVSTTTFTFSGANQYRMTSGVNYTIEVNYTSGNVSNSVNVGYDFTILGHSGNQFYYNGSYTTNDGADTEFVVFASTSSSPPSGTSMLVGMSF